MDRQKEKCISMIQRKPWSEHMLGIAKINSLENNEL